MEYRRTCEDRLYVCSDESVGASFCGYLLPSSTLAPDAFGLPASLAEQSGHFLFSAWTPDLEDQSSVEALIETLDTFIADVAKSGERTMLWLCGPTDDIAARIEFLTFSSDSTTHRTMRALQAPLLGDSLGIRFGTDAIIAATTDTLSFLSSRSASVEFVGPLAVTVIADDSRIPVTGPQAGTLLFDSVYRTLELAGKLNLGFRFTTTRADDATRYRDVHFSLLDAEAVQPESVALRTRIDVTDVFNASVPKASAGETPMRTEFAFHAPNNEQHAPLKVLQTSFVDGAGHSLALLPVRDASDSGQAARFVFHAAADPRPAYLSPAGDFWLVANGRKPGETLRLLCGRSATEVVVARNNSEDSLEGHRLRFHPYRPAFAPQFPLLESSPLGPPVDCTAPKLDDTFTTPWISVVGTPPVAYSAQPSGSPLYGKDDVIHPVDTAWLGFIERPMPLGAEACPPFPAPPQAGAVLGESPSGFDAAALEAFDVAIVSPARRGCLTATLAFDARSVAGDETITRATTPAGLIAEVDANGGWRRVNLAYTKPDLSDVLRLTNMDAKMQAAFSTNRLFAVVANSTHLGKLSASSDPDDDEPRFFNSVAIGDWRFRINVGVDSRYGSYRKVLIFKFLPGRLTELVANPTSWAEAESLALPGAAANADELVVLSQWLGDYIESARRQTTEKPNLQHFVEIADSESWTGILALAVDIEGLPEELRGLLGGMDESAVHAHHIGINATPVTGAEIEVEKESSVFGLIDYVAPTVDPKRPSRPVHHNVETDFDFAVLTLNVRFRNTSVVDFKTETQLVLRRFLGAPAQYAGDSDKEAALVLDGRYARNGDRRTFVMESSVGTTLTLRDQIVPSVRIGGAAVVPPKTGSGESSDPAPTVTLRFAIQGTIEFVEIPGYDLFSFGTGGDDAGGLAFSALELRLSFPLDDPTKRSFELDAGRMSFDPGQSRWRPQSWFARFPLRVTELVVGGEETTPSDLGYLNVKGSRDLKGASSPWYGLRMELDMGTPGSLADAAGFNADVLLSWSPNRRTEAESYPAELGIKLPGTTGADVFGLQGVIMVAIGDVRLLSIPHQDGNVGYLLRLDDIALTFLGLAKIPPAGSTGLYLFGDPGSGGSGLGWYAIYKPKTDKTTSIDRDDPPRLQRFDR